MALIALVSAKGAPGVSTAALALARTWPRPVVLVEADTAGPSVLPGLMRGTIAQVGGLAPLAVAAAHNELPERFWDQTCWLPAGPPNGKQRHDTGPREAFLLPGLTSPDEAPALRNLWGPLASHLAALEAAGCDALVDLGRLAQCDDRDVLVTMADVVAVVTRAWLPDVTATLRLVAARVPTGARATTPWRTLVVDHGPYSAAEISHNAGIRAAGSLAWDPDAAKVLSVGATETNRFTTSALIRTARTVAHDLLRDAQRRRGQLGLAEA
ncbi:MAG: hypothetical protein FWF02_10450 [Micrococcales bacterium]|nr:hypothetical protein [Micrococcales bacterium]MCL2668107.1 hypothetical protein [Micrococcales bacterium]